MVAALRTRGLADVSVLEVGAGAGTALATMLEAGVVRCTGVDISPSYEETARQVLEPWDEEVPISWHTGDFVALAPTLQASDVVFLNRVVCCYPAMEDLVDAAAAKAKRYLAMSYPRRRLLVRLAIRLGNAWLRLNRNSFRAFVHDPEAVAARVTRSGLTEVAAGTTFVWHWGLWERQPQEGGR